jgi:TolA-binding protein
MESDVTQSAAFFKAWAWAEAHRKQLLMGLAGAAVVGVVVGFYISQKHQKQVSASEALSLATSQAMVTGKPAAPGEFQKVAADHAGTSAAERALLLAGGRFFAEGKYAEAQAEFQKFSRAHPGSEFAGIAALGAANALEASGKTDEAIKAYKEITERRSTDPVMPQAKLALARLYQAQGNLTQARDTYRQLAQTGMGSATQEAMLQLQLLMRKHPELMETAAPTQAPMILSAATNALSTNVVTTNLPAIQMQP